MDVQLNAQVILLLETDVNAVWAGESSVWNIM
jgi:hypothetical protein